MNHLDREEIEIIGGNSEDIIWRWFLKNGPHGNSFTWSQTRGEPAGYVGIEHLQEIIEEKNKLEASFSESARHVVAMALKSNNPNFLRRAIQIAAVVGSEIELQEIAYLTKHENSKVAADARACAFQLKAKLKSCSRA